MPYTVAIKCICCEGLTSFGDCPLCENVRFFEETIIGEIDEFMLDFYNETLLDSSFYRKNETKKKEYLDDELDRYFNKS